MRKFAPYGIAALLVLSGGASILYAQDTATTPDTTQVAAAPFAPIGAARIWLGVTVDDSGDGVTITHVSAGSPAEDAGLQADDVITAINGTAVDTVADLRAVVDAASAGDVVTLTITRAGEEMSVDVTLAERMGHGMFNLASDPLQAAEFALDVDLEAVDGGYQVTAVHDNAPFDLVEGDVITAVNGVDITTLDWTTLFTPGTDSTGAPVVAPTVTLTVTRDGVETTVEGQLDHFGFGGRGRGNGPQGGPQGGFPDGRGGRGGQQNGQPNGQPLNPPGDRNGQNGAAPAAPSATPESTPGTSV